MLSFIRSLPSNRFGIVLTAFNLCYLLYTYNNYPGFWTLPAKIIVCMNLPALTSAAITSKILYVFLPTISHSQLMNVIFPLFVVVQWFLIAHLAKLIAKKLNRYV